jgi:pimeloyl-ACP methyl ester carboxylesterase
MTSENGKQPTVVLVHGGFVDGSGWEAVYKLLRKEGYKVNVVQNPTISLADDAATTKRAISAANEPVVLVGHSYGGVVITEAGTTIRTSWGWSISRPLRPTRASRCPA